MLRLACAGNTCVCRGVVGACVETCPVGARNRKCEYLRTKNEKKKVKMFLTDVLSADCNCPCPDALAATCDAAGVSLTWSVRLAEC